MGGNPKGLLLGIVNGEAAPLDCSNQSLKTFNLDEYECRLNKISCRFVNEIHDSFAIKVCSVMSTRKLMMSLRYILSSFFIRNIMSVAMKLRTMHEGET